jgi:Polyketide cyclase / dehydrase and lipid transport
MIFVYIFIGLVVTILLISLLMPKTYNVERSIVIKKTAEEIKKYVGDFNHYAAWNPWQKMEPASVKTISGAPHSPGHKYEWKGKKIGTGSLTLKKTDPKHIHIDLEFLKPWKAKAKDNWLFEPWGDDAATKVTWQNSGELPWPIARLMGPMISKNLNHQFGTGLENLKNMCENN